MASETVCVLMTPAQKARATRERKRREWLENAREQIANNKVERLALISAIKSDERGLCEIARLARIKPALLRSFVDGISRFDRKTTENIASAVGSKV